MERNIYDEDSDSNSVDIYSDLEQNKNLNQEWYERCLLKSTKLPYGQNFSNSSEQKNEVYKTISSLGCLNKDELNKESLPKLKGLEETVNELDLYSDILTTELAEKQERRKAEKQEHKKLLLENIELKKLKENLSSELATLNKKNLVLKRNICSLYKTAKQELNRKNDLIAELREKNDSLIFRRNRLQVMNNTSPENSPKGSSGQKFSKIQQSKQGQNNSNSIPETKEKDINNSRSLNPRKRKEISDEQTKKSSERASLAKQSFSKRLLSDTCDKKQMTKTKTKDRSYENCGSKTELSSNNYRNSETKLPTSQLSNEFPEENIPCRNIKQSYVTGSDSTKDFANCSQNIDKPNFDKNKTVKHGKYSHKDSVDINVESSLGIQSDFFPSNGRKGNVNNCDTTNKDKTCNSASHDKFNLSSQPRTNNSKDRKYDKFRGCYEDEIVKNINTGKYPKFEYRNNYNRFSPSEKEDLQRLFNYIGHDVPLALKRRLFGSVKAPDKMKNMFS